jgi:hypothetical protein
MREKSIFFRDIHIRKICLYNSKNFVFATSFVNDGGQQLCMCNRWKHEHDTEARLEPNGRHVSPSHINYDGKEDKEIWRKGYSTKKFPTNAYGILFGSNAPVMYMTTVTYLINNILSYVYLFYSIFDAVSIQNPTHWR